MPNDEAKKKWRVSTWSMDDYASTDREVEAKRLENALNKLSDEKYEIYEVDFKKNLIVGRLEEEEEEVPSLFAGLPPPPTMPASFAAVLQDIFSRRRQEREQAQTPPAEVAAEATATAAEAMQSALAAQQTDDIESVPQPGDEFKPESKLTMQFFGCLNNVIEAKLGGDPHTEARVTSLIKQMFRGISVHEVQKCLTDTERYHSQHRAMRKREGIECHEEGCALHTVFKITEEKLKAHLAANPVS